MKKNSKLLVAALVVALALCALPNAALANSAEPPLLTVVLSNAPEDTLVELRYVDGTTVSPLTLSHTSKAWENYFRFYLPGNDVDFDRERVYIVISAGDEVINEIVLTPDELTDYNTLLYIDCTTMAVSYGMPFARNALLIAIRVVCTLIIEGLVLLIFGYRAKRSWLIFLIVNLVTQTALNILLCSAGAYAMFALVLCEGLVFAVEALVFALTMKEKKWWVALLYALVANALSLGVGALLITYLPV
ncbi:MAG: hypothetical protein Q4B99_05115 [Clostridia bacterium]|nr:hypothetical protein [Clostridia bacterium]